MKRRKKISASLRIMSAADSRGWTDYTLLNLLLQVADERTVRKIQKIAREEPGPTTD